MAKDETSGPATTSRRRFLEAAGLTAALAATTATIDLAEAQSLPRPSGVPTAAEAGRSPIMRSTGRVAGSVTALGLGTFLTFDLLPGADREPLHEVTRRYLEGGVAVVDTSPLYGTGETSLGAFLAGLGGSDRLFVSNKVWSTGEYLADESHALRSLEQSQLRLWRRQLDVMFCHSLVNVDVVVPMLNAWKREGRIRMVGISHHENAYHDIIADLIARGQVDAVQINYSIFNRGIESRILPAAAERGVAVFINMAMEKGRLDKVVQGRPVPDFAREFGAQTWSQFFLKWVMAETRVTSVLTATSNPEHASQNVACLHGPLPDAALRRRMVQHMEGIPGFNSLGGMPWYPDKQAQYQGVIRREQARLRQRLS